MVFSRGGYFVDSFLAASHIFFFYIEPSRKCHFTPFWNIQIYLQRKHTISDTAARAYLFIYVAFKKQKKPRFSASSNHRADAIQRLFVINKTSWFGTDERDEYHISCDGERENANLLLNCTNSERVFFSPFLRLFEIIIQMEIKSSDNNAIFVSMIEK